MKLDFAVLELADTALISCVNNSSPIFYLKALESMCRSSGWTLSEYWNTMLNKIDANWEDTNIKLVN